MQLMQAFSTYRMISTYIEHDESHNPHLDLGSIIGSLDMLGFMVWELVAETNYSTGYYIENGIYKRYRTQSAAVIFALRRVDDGTLKQQDLTWNQKMKNGTVMI